LKPIKVIILNSKSAPYTLWVKTVTLRGLAILLRELANTNAEIRYEACGAYCELGDEQVVTYLIELVNDSDTEVQLAAIRALGKIGGIEAEECLKRCLNDSSELVQQTAEKALNELGAEEDPLSLKFNTFDT